MIQEETTWLASSCCHGKVAEQATNIPGSFHLSWRVVAANGALKLGVVPENVGSQDQAKVHVMTHLWYRHLTLGCHP